MRRRVPIRKLKSRLGAALCVVAVAACHKAEAPAEGKQATVSANTIVVTPRLFTETLEAIGTVTPRTGHVASLSAPAAGRVGQVLVTTGRAVRAGDPLIELDQAPFQATLEAAQAAFAAAEQANERQQRLVKEGITPRKDAEQATAELARTRNDLAQARRASSLSIIKSPIDGVVTRMSATLGASVDPAQPLVEISDPTKLDILLSVTPTDAARVHPGAKTTLSAGQSAVGEPLGYGTVIDVSGTIDSLTRSVNVRVQAPTTRRMLRIGETVFGAIAVASRPGAIVIPAEALVPEGEAFKVFVVDANGIAHAREVTIGGKTSTSIEIVQGLKSGERVVTYGAYGVQDSAKVVPLVPLSDSAKVEVPAKPEKP